MQIHESCRHVARSMTSRATTAEGTGRDARGRSASAMLRAGVRAEECFTLRTCVRWGSAMAPWAWLVLGVGAFAVEMFVIDAQFYLVFLGAAAAIVGLLSLLLPIPDPIQWLIFAALSIITML